MPGPFRRHFEKPDRRDRPSRPGEKDHCKLCGQRIDSYRNDRRCAEAWLAQQPVQRKEPRKS